MAKDSHDPVDVVMDTFSKFTAGNDKRLDALQEQLDQIQMISNRPNLGGSGSPSASSPELISAFRGFLRTGDDSRLNAMTTSSDDEGGYLVLPNRGPGWIAKLHDQSPIRRLARIETIESGNSWEEPIDFGDVEATWIGEHGARTEGAAPTIGLLTIHLHEIYAMQGITQRMVDDSSKDVLGWMEGKIGDKFGRTEGTSFISGNGVIKPQGILSAPVSADPDATRAWGTLRFGTSGAAAAVTADGLRDLVWSLRAPYRRAAVWLMNSNTASRIDKLKNGNGDYIWRDGMTAGAPPSLLGYEVHFDENLPDVEAGAFPITFGNLKVGYIIVDRPGLRFLRDPYSAKPNILVYAYKRTGGGVANSEALRVLKIGV